MQRLSIQRTLMIALACLAGGVLAADFKLKDGTTLSGEMVGPNDKSVIIRNADNKLSPRTAWTNFTQEALKEFAKNPKARVFVEPLLEVEASTDTNSAAELNVPEIAIVPRDWKQPKEVETKPVLPDSPGLFGGMFTTGVGWLSLLAGYLGVIYAGYEVALYRRRPKQLVMGLSAIPFVGIAAPIAFLAMPPIKTEEEAKPNSVAQAAAAAAKEEPKADPKSAPGKKKPGLAFGKKAEEGHAAPAGPKPVATAKPSAPAAAPAAPAASKPAALEPAVYRRGETNINKRFIETKFAGFFKAIPGPAERDMWLVWVTATGGEYWSKRVVSISQTEVVVNCPQEGGGSLDQTVQIVEIQEIHLRPQEG